MRRRALLGGLGSLLLDTASGYAQQAQRKLVLFIGAGPDNQNIIPRTNALRAELARLGWPQGKTLSITEYFGLADPERISTISEKLVTEDNDLIIAHSPPVAIALVKAGVKIPIAFFDVPDPIGAGLVQSMAKPGGNVTGVVTFDQSVAGKWISILKSLSSKIETIGILGDLGSPTFPFYVSAIHGFAEGLGLRFSAITFKSASELREQLFDPQRQAGGLVVPSTNLLSLHRADVLEAIRAASIPSIFASRDWADSGGLASYDADRLEGIRQAAGYVDKILRGGNPGILPVQTPRRYEFIINKTAARELGIELKPDILALADEVIE